MIQICITAKSKKENVTFSQYIVLAEKTYYKEIRKTICLEDGRIFYEMAL